MPQCYCDPSASTGNILILVPQQRLQSDYSQRMLLRSTRVFNERRGCYCSAMNGVCRFAPRRPRIPEMVIRPLPAKELIHREHQPPVSALTFGALAVQESKSHAAKYPTAGTVSDLPSLTRQRAGCDSCLEGNVLNYTGCSRTIVSAYISSTKQGGR